MTHDLMHHHDHAHAHSRPAPILARALAWPFLVVIGAYQRWISPSLPPSCRFTPSCSRYAVTALQTHQLPRALGLIVWRLARCQPFCAGGHDPVPPGAFAPDVSTSSSSPTARMAA